MFAAPPTHNNAHLNAHTTAQKKMYECEETVAKDKAYYNYKIYIAMIININVFLIKKNISFYHFWPYRAALLVKIAGKRYSPYITDLYEV